MARQQDRDIQSIKRKAGRLLFIGLPGTRLDKRTRSLLGEVQPGGVVLFGRNVESAEQVALLNAQIRDAVDHPVLIGVDQEGGLVDRFREICEPAPSAKAVRDAASSELAQKFGELSARVLRLMGFNINFAPVLDLRATTRRTGSAGEPSAGVLRKSPGSRALTSTGCRRGASWAAANTSPDSAAPT